MYTWLNFIIASLATYYAALSITKQDGPWEVFGKLRAHWSENDWKGRGIRCHVCVSAYTALLVTIGAGLLGWADAWAWPLTWLGLAGASVVLNKYWER